MLEKLETVGIVGLGYVGLQLAVAFGTRRQTIGFDPNHAKLEAYSRGYDPNGEITEEQLHAASMLAFTSDPSKLVNASLILVAVPTPIDQAKRPDLSPLESACRIIAPYLRSGVVVVFESTVYPGCTEEVCVPILEEASGLMWAGRGSVDGESVFYVGYSPERINPGDSAHRLENITKVVAADTTETLGRLKALYESIVKAGVHSAPSIKVAEAAKVIENTQRDLNIALMNELAIIFERLGIDTLDVLEAAGTKWNFLPFRPGLVGGHCIGVDPYYLTYKAESAGYYPQVVLAGRRINDGMGKFIAEQTVKQLASRGMQTAGARLLVLGITFKENCSDLRNSRVLDLVRELIEYGCTVAVHDPIADSRDAAAEYGIKLEALADIGKSQAVVLAVPHKHYSAMSCTDFQGLLNPDGLLIDVKGVIDRDEADKAGLELWRV